MVTKYLREAQMNPAYLTPLSDAISLHLDNSDDSPMRPLEELSFYSIRRLAGATRRSVATVNKPLSEKLGLDPRHRRWVTPRLSDDQKA
jgi:hypothetical protein